MLEFYSIDSDNNEVHYLSVYERHGNTLIFDDKSSLDTKVELTIGNEFRIQRIGKISMDFIFNLEKPTTGKYENELGLSLIFDIKTKEMIYENDKFFISYDLYLDGDKISEHHIKIKIIA